MSSFIVSTLNLSFLLGLRLLIEIHWNICKKSRYYSNLYPWEAQPIESFA